MKYVRRWLSIALCLLLALGTTCAALATEDGRTIVPYGEACTLETQIKSDGTMRKYTSEELYETLSFTLKMDAYRSPIYFQEHYANLYKLRGEEAAVSFDITLNDYEVELSIVPQNALQFGFVGADSSITNQGYQLTDAEIAGKTEIAVSTGEATKLYKRFNFSDGQGEMVYMVVTAYNDGVASEYWFEIMEGGDGAFVGEGSLARGSRGDEVVALQRVLIKLGLLTGNPDGIFGKYTEAAVKTMQARYGMRETGVATPEFLERLYSENP